ncbi:hypothetical protein VCHA53O466_50449 [Vibrio chagasii]|nr:hypothetical protein VCHA53O466_50449 [Vibrio chagasii]
MYKDFDKIIDDGSLGLPFDELVVLVRRIIQSHEGGINGAYSWLSHYKYEVGAELLYKAIAEVFFSDSFDDFRVQCDGTTECLGGFASLCISYFRHHDIAVDIAKKSLGSELFTVVEKAVFESWRKLMCSVLDAKDVHWATQHELNELYQNNTQCEFKDSRYLNAFMEIQQEVGFAYLTIQQSN